MPSSLYKTKEEVLLKGREAIGIHFEEINKSNKLKELKGGIGKMIELDWFDIENNNTPEPDFKEAGVELKVTPYFYNSRGLRAKERLVCNIINYEKEDVTDFYASSFWEKNETILLMSYHDTTPEIDAKRKKNKENKLSNKEKYELKKKFKIDEVALFKIPDRDLGIIMNDWSIIVDKIKNGQAHELSEKQTMYLAACTKGNTAESSMRNQRGKNNVKAKERAYSLKSSYMTYILNTFLYGEEEDENIIKDVDLVKYKGIEEYIIEKIKPYYGMSQAELKKLFKVTSSAKSLNRILISKILEVNNVENSAEFKKAGINIKTISVESNGKNIKQNMSFPAVKFLDLVDESWEESMTKEIMVDTKYMFAIFKKDEYYNEDKRNSEHTENHLILNNILFWQLPKEDEEEVEKVWTRACKSIIKGAGLKKEKYGKRYRMTNTLPKQSESKVAHMRPHTTKSGYTDDSPYADMLPNGNYMTKQCFWFNREYILKQIIDNIL